MAVRIRLAKCGRRHLAEYHIVVADAKAPRDGRFIEKVGHYNPHTTPSTVKLNEISALKWLLQGAQPTDTVRNLLSKQGLMLKKQLQMGVRKGAITQTQADERFTLWKTAQR